MLDKQGVYDCLRDHHIDFEITDHAPLFSMDDKPNVQLPYPDWDAKNLFIRDHKREHYYLITVRGSKRVDLKQFRKDHKLKKISFGSEEELWDILKIKPGHVSPSKPNTKLALTIIPRLCNSLISRSNSSRLFCIL